MAGNVSEVALFWPGGQSKPSLVGLIGVGTPDPESGRSTLIMSAGRHRYLVDEADIMRLPAAAGIASLSPVMGTA